MADRTLVVSLRAEAAQFRTAMNDAAASADKAGAAAEGAGRKVQASAQQVEAAGRKVTDSRRQQQDAAARLNTAEKKLDEVKRNSKASASQVAQAEERVLTSRNRLEKATETLEAAEKSHSRSMQAAAKSADQSKSKFQQFAQQMERDSEAWNTAGTAFSVLGGAIVGVGLAAGKAGIEFNSLKQTSGAALKSVLGSAEAASRQMDKLNNFGKDSWVMRDVLIRAQQQMTGFGVETKKVIPYLDGLQEAVAAAGGDSQTFEELAGVMAKVKSQGKITAETFNEFGSRGVDAATIIGEQMGKTGQEIRASVTEGSLDADQALDALAEGMKTKFEGASDNLRNTFRGAMDNLSAAWRDLSATMAEPIVGPDGGGLGVGALNALTDAITNVQEKANELPNAGKTAVLGLGGLAGAGSLAAGGFLLLAPRIVETKKALDTLAKGGGIVGKAAGSVGGLGKTLGIAAAAFGAFQAANWAANKVTKASIPSLEKINSELREMSKNGGDLTGAFGNSNAFADWIGGSKPVEDMGDALEIVSLRSEQGITGLAKFREAITPGRQELERATDGIKAYDEGFADLVNNGNIEQATEAFKNIKIPDDMSVSEVMEHFSGYRDALQGVANDLDVTGLKEKDYYEWMRGNIPPAIQEATEAQKQAADGYTGMSEAAQAAQEHLEEVRKGLIDSANGFLDFTEKARESKTTLQEWINDMEKQVEAQASWMDNLAVLAERGAPQELLDQLMSMGPEGAAMVKKLADGSDEDMQRVIDAFKESGRNVNEFANKIAGIPPIDLDADASKLKRQVKTAEDRLAELRKLPTTPEIDAQITALEEQVKAGRAKLKDLEKEKTTAKVDADTSEAKEDVNSFKQWFKDHSTVTMKVIQNIKRVFDPDLPEQPGGKRDKKGNNSRSPMGRAIGGPIFGPGSGTSDDVPIMASNGEHMWTAAEVNAAGGHGGVEALRAAVLNGGIGAFASGGPIGAAQRRLDSAQHALDSINKTSRKVTAEDRRRDAAQKRVDDARAALDRAKEAEAKRERIALLQGDFRQDVRRGNIRDQVTGSLSGGYSAVDRLMGLGDNEDLSRGSRSRATSSARKFEANLRSLYAQAERIDSRLKKAQDKAQELKGIKDTVASSLLGGRDLDVGTFQTRDASGAWSSQSNLGQAAKSMKMDVGAMKAFAGKLKKLTELGIPGAIIQEIAQAGVEEGSNMADSFIDATAAERKSYLGAWSDYEKYANQAGQYVTEGFHKGGAAAADGVVKGLEGKQKNVEAAIANLAKTMESTFKQVLGIHSPSRVMADLGGFTAEGLVQGMLGGVSDVQSAAAALGSAAVPNMMAFQPTDMNMDVGVNPVVADDEGMAGLAMQDMSTTTLEAMSVMGTAVSEGFAGMLANVQATQAAMLLDTQFNQSEMLTATQASNLGQLTDTQLQQAAMLLNTQTQNAAMLLNTQTQQEAMRSTVESKQIGQKTAAETQQEAMRLMLIDKQGSMKTKSAEDFESLKNTTGSKFGAMRTATDTTMSNIYGDYDTRLASLKGLNKRGFESLLSTSNTNMEGIRDGIDAQMAAAKPELGGRMNDLISVLGKFTASVNKAFGDVGVKLDAPKSLKYADGGVLPGYTPGRDIYKFHNPALGNLELSGGEGIIRPEGVRYMGGAAGIDRFNRLAKSGMLDQSDHFADGGVLPTFTFANGGTLTDAAKWWQSKGTRITEFGAWGQRVGRHSPNSLHYSGRAFDANYGPGGQNAIEQAFFDRMIPVFKPQFPGIRIIWRAPGHYNHAHFDNGGGADIGSTAGGGSFMGHPFLDRAGITAGSDLQASYAKAAKKLTAQIYSKHSKDLPDGIAGQLGKGIMSQVSEGLVGKAKEYGKTTAVSGTTAGDPAVKAAVRKIAEQMGWGKYWGDIDWLVNKESSWNPNAANPSSSARGLFQKMTSLHGPVEDTVEGQARWGLNYIKSAYGNPAKARAHHQRSNWYEGGTERAKRGLAVVGEEGPELVNFQGGEQVLSTADSMKFMAANRTYIPTQSGPSFDASAFTDAVSQAVRVNGVTPEAVAAAMDGIRMTFVTDSGQFTGAVHAAVATGYDQSRSRLSKSSQKIGAR